MTMNCVGGKNKSEKKNPTSSFEWNSISLITHLCVQGKEICIVNARVLISKELKSKSVPS